MFYRVFDRHNITLRDCVDFSDVFLDGFRNDLLFKLLLPKKYLFATESWSSSTDDEMFSDPNYRRMLWSRARQTHLAILSGRCLLVLLYEEPDYAVACTLFRLPEYSPALTRLSLWQRFLLAMRSSWYSLIDRLIYFWADGDSGGPFADPEWVNVHDVGDEHCGASLKTNPLAKLARMSQDELKLAPYPKEYAYYLNILSVRMSRQRMGLGSRICDLSFEFLPRVGPTFKDGEYEVQGPPKVGLFSSPAGHSFYEREKFRLVGFYDEARQNGLILPHRYFMRLLE